MEEKKKICTVSKIIGILVESNASALEASEVLGQAQKTFLERCWHVSNKKAD